MDFCVGGCNKFFVISFTFIIDVHRIADGALFQKVDIWNWLPWRESYRLLCVNKEPDALIVLMDPGSAIYLFDLSSARNEPYNFKFDDSQRFVFI